MNKQLKQYLSTIGTKGGLNTYEKHGSSHFAKIGAKGRRNRKKKMATRLTIDLKGVK